MKCECDPCGCHDRYGVGPAAIEATRDGKRIKLCTRCILSGDVDRVVVATDPAPLLAYDRSGAHSFVPDVCPRSGDDLAQDFFQALKDIVKGDA